MKVSYRADRRPALGRLRVLANGGLPEVHWGACQQSVVDFSFAAGADIQAGRPIRSIALNLAKVKGMRPANTP
jgi:hypothetical protein